MNGVRLSGAEEEKDLSITVIGNLTPERHISKITGETYNLLRRIRQTFAYMDEEMVRKMIVSLIRPRLEYTSVAWSPYKKKDTRKLERSSESSYEDGTKYKGLVIRRETGKNTSINGGKEETKGRLDCHIYKASEGTEEVERSGLMV